MGLFSNRISPGQLRPGDHIYSWRFAYSYAHHGIYVGDGKVIHFTRGQGQELGTGTSIDLILTASTNRHDPVNNPCDKCSSTNDSNGVLLSCLDCFLAGCPLYRFQYAEKTAIFLAKARGGTCTLAASDPPEVVLHRAFYILNNGSGFGCYHLFRKNCEDFALYCKTGLLIVNERTIGTSGQAISFFGVPLAAVCTSPLNFVMGELSLGMAVVTAGMYCLSRYYGDLGNRNDVVKVPVEDLVARINSTPLQQLQP